VSLADRPKEREGGAALEGGAAGSRPRGVAASRVDRRRKKGEEKEGGKEKGEKRKRKRRKGKMKEEKVK
jgi:hypothetical protein